MVHDHLWRMAWPTAGDAKIVEPFRKILADAPDAGGQYDFGFERCAEPLREILCIRCLELRLGRALTAADFTDAPVNDTRRWRVLYGELDEFTVAPFVKYGEPLSNEGRRLASLLNRALHGRLPITADIRFELVHFLAAFSDPTKGIDQRRYDMALHRQKLIALLERYGRRSRAFDASSARIAQAGRAQTPAIGVGSAPARPNTGSRSTERRSTC